MEMGGPQPMEIDKMWIKMVESHRNMNVEMVGTLPMV